MKNKVQVLANNIHVKQSSRTRDFERETDIKIIKAYLLASG